MKENMEKVKKTDYKDGHSKYKQFIGRTGEFVRNQSQKFK